MRFCFAKFGRLDRKHFSSTWLACETSLLIQSVADKSFYAARLEVCRMANDFAPEHSVLRKLLERDKIPLFF